MGALIDNAPARKRLVVNVDLVRLNLSKTGREHLKLHGFPRASTSAQRDLQAPWSALKRLASGRKDLKELKTLQILNLVATGVTARGVRELRNALPKFDISGESK